MVLVKAYYQNIFNLDLSAYQTCSTVNDSSSTEIDFETQEEFTEFMSINELRMTELPGGRTVLVSEHEEIYGLVVNPTLAHN